MANTKSNQPMLVSKVAFPLIPALLPKWIALHKNSQNFASKTEKNMSFVNKEKDHKHENKQKTILTTLTLIHQSETTKMKRQIIQSILALS